MWHSLNCYPKHVNSPLAHIYKYNRQSSPISGAMPSDQTQFCTGMFPLIIFTLCTQLET